MNKPTIQAIWGAIGEDNVEEFQKYVSDEHSYRFATVRMWNQKSEDGIKSRSLFEICSVNKVGVPEQGAPRILKFIIETFPHLVTVNEVVKSIKMAEMKKREGIMTILLDFMNSNFLDIKGFEDTPKKWILRERYKNTNQTLGYFVSFKPNQTWMSMDCYIHKPQTCPFSNAKLLPVILLSFEDANKKVKLPQFARSTRIPSIHFQDTKYKGKETESLDQRQEKKSPTPPLPEEI